MGDRNLTALFFFTPSPRRRRRRPPSSPVARLVRGFLQLRRDPEPPLRAVSRVVTILAARAALGVLRLRAVSSEVTFPRCSFCTCPRVSALSALFPRPFSCPARRNLSPSDRLGRSGCRHLPDQPRGVRAVVSGLCHLCRLCRRRGFAGTLSRSARIDRRCDTSRRLCRRLCRQKTRLCRHLKTREYPPTRKTSPCGQTRRICCIAYRSSVAPRIRQRAVSRPVAKVSASAHLSLEDGPSRTRRHRLVSYPVAPPRLLSGQSRALFYRKKNHKKYGEKGWGEKKII